MLERGVDRLPDARNEDNTAMPGLSGVERGEGKVVKITMLSEHWRNLGGEIIIATNLRSC